MVEELAGDGDARMAADERVDLPQGEPTRLGADASLSTPADAPPPRVPAAQATSGGDALVTSALQVQVTARLRRQRQKAAANVRKAAKREQVAKYASLQYGGEETPVTRVNCPLWSSAPDLKMAFTKVSSEVTARCAAAARGEGLNTRAVSLLFGGVSYSVSVLSGTVAGEMAATERSIDLLVLLSSGLTEEGLKTLVRRWSKRVARAGDGRSMDDEG